MKKTFKKTERLHSKLLINKLFVKGKSFTVYPYRVTILKVDKNDGPPVQVLIAVSKRNIKLAVNRNKIKRQIRESYRKNKQLIWEAYSDKPNEQLLLSLVYIGKTITSYSELERKLILILHRLIKKDENTDR